MARNTEKRAKIETHSISPGICQETVKNVNNEKYTLQHLDYGQRMKNVENETKTQLDLEYGEKHCKRVKMRNSHGSTWNMARNTENEQNGKQTPQNVEYGEKTENH